MRSKRYVLLLMLSTTALSGCGTWFHPYHEDYLCPGGDTGKCAKVKQAYEESFRRQSEDFSPLVKTKKEIDENDVKSVVKDEEYNYKNELYKELAGLIRNPETPVLMPARQKRVLIPGYTGKDNSIYYGYRYVYFMDTDPQWTLPTLKERAQGD